MKKIIFFSTPAYGHILAEEPIIRDLVKNGYSVDWYSSKRFRNIIDTSGANFKPYRKDFESLYELSEVTEDFYVLMKTILDISRDCFVEYIDEVKHQEPAIILYDSMCAFAKNIAGYLGIKSVCLCSTIAFNLLTSTCTNLVFPIIKLGAIHCFDIIKLIREEKKFRDQYNLQPLHLIDLFVNKGDITIVLSPPEFQPFRWSFPKSFKFVGSTTSRKRCILKQDYEECDIYISLGSIFTENKAFLEDIRDSGALDGNRVVVNVGNASMESKNANMKFLDYTDQLALLKKTKVFINHGGINSIYDSIYSEVPQICFPQQEEQRMTAKIVQKKHLGIYVKRFDIEKINDYIRRTQKNNSNINKYSRILKNTDGTKNAVQEIEKLIKEGRGSTK